MPTPRRFRFVTNWLGTRLRPKVLLALLVLLALAALLLWWAKGIGQYGQNLALNVGADLVGASVVIFVISPLITRAQYGRVREHRRMDYGLFTNRVMQATTEVRVLDTFSNLFDQPRAEWFFRAAREAMNRQAHVRILLLHPDSRAARQRASELGADRAELDLHREVMRNVRLLDEFARSLTDPLSRRFEAKLYAASASVTLYRWDERSLISFLPIGRLSGDGTQLEVGSTSPLGTFVGERFDELWDHGTPIEECLRMRLDVTDGDSTAFTHHCEYVMHQERLHVADPALLAHLAARTANLYATTLGGETFLLDAVDPAEQDRLAGLFADKYERTGHSFVRLTPYDG